MFHITKQFDDALRNRQLSVVSNNIIVTSLPLMLCLDVNRAVGLMIYFSNNLCDKRVDKCSFPRTNIYQA